MQFDASRGSVAKVLFSRWESENDGETRCARCILLHPIDSCGTKSRPLRISCWMSHVFSFILSSQQITYRHIELNWIMKECDSWLIVSWARPRRAASCEKEGKEERRGRSCRFFL